MFQPRSASIHASALLVTPDERDGEDVECFDFVPIKRVDDLLVSENDGYELDEMGLLKNDCLATKELSKLQAIMKICNDVYDTNMSLESIVMGDLDNTAAYSLLGKVHTQNIFQFASKGMTKFLMSMNPTCINDLIAANALYRPATLENGSTDAYVNCKQKIVAPTYLWGTYNALKDTFGNITYQEQVVLIAREVGGLSLGEGVNLVKYISKKKIDKIRDMKGKFMEGAKKNGCPQEDADRIWEQIEACGSYLFNKCISGKEKIYRPNSSSWHPTIEEMYNILNDTKYAKATGHWHCRKNYVEKGYGTGYSINKWQFVERNYIRDIRYAGVRELYRITLSDGETIDVTANHKHPTQRGEVRTDKLVIGEDRMFVFNGNDKRALQKIVTSIESIGYDKVYDIEMFGPNHSFTTMNKVITCNSHATAYAVTSYVGAALKASYPTAFYTVGLQWANDDELVSLMGEMEECSKAKVVPPDINMSAEEFYTDYTTDSIFWSLSRIKQLGSKAVQWIVREKEKNGPFVNIDNFIDRVFKYKLKKYEYWDDPDNEDEVQRCPVNARCVLNLILAGCFDKVENALSSVERYAIIHKAAERLGFEVKESDFPQESLGKHYFWAQWQLKVSGIGSMDYKRVYDNSNAKPLVKGRGIYAKVKEALDEGMDGRRVVVCATVVDVEERRFVSKKTGDNEVFCKLLLQQNNDTIECILWTEDYAKHRGAILGAKDKLIVALCVVRYSDFAKSNALQFYKNSILEVL